MLAFGDMNTFTSDFGPSTTESSKMGKMLEVENDLNFDFL